MSRNILLADDSLTIQKVVELTFMEGDFEVTAVSNGDEALARLDEGAPDVVIADVHMPGADGFAIAKASKERYPGTPVLLLVGTFEPFDEASAETSGADAHLKKPFDSQELLRLVEDLLASGEAEAPSAESSDEETVEDTSFADVGSEAVEVSFSEEVVGGADDPVLVSPPAGMEEAEPESTVAADGGEEDSMMTTPVALSDEDVDRIARRVVELLGDQTIREISWDVIPDLAEIVIKDRIRELESQVD